MHIFQANSSILGFFLIYQDSVLFPPAFHSGEHKEEFETAFRVSYLEIKQ